MGKPRICHRTDVALSTRSTINGILFFHFAILMWCILQ